MNISLIGTGLLGSAMAQRLLQPGHSLTVYNRSAANPAFLKKKGAHVASSTLEAIESSDCIISVLPNGRVTKDVLLNMVNRTYKIKNQFKGKTFIQMGTIAPLESQYIAKKISQQAGEYFEAPVLGSKQEALDGSMLVMAGCSKKQFTKWKSLLSVFGPQPRRIGEVGQAAALKLALNNLIASHAVAFSLSLGIVEKYQVNVDDFMSILRKSSLYAPMFDKKLERWVKRDYENPNFTTNHLLKDIDLILKTAIQQKLNNDFIKSLRRIYMQAVHADLGPKDYSSVYSVINPFK